jgi:type I restriction enzyme S subunit
MKGNNGLKKLPQLWKLLEFKEFVTKSKSKYAPSPNDERKCLELEHINQVDGSINGWITSKYQKSTKNVFKENEVLFGKLRPYLRKYWLSNFEGVCSSEIWVLKSLNSVICSNEYLYRLIQSDRFIQAANVTSGTKMPRADWSYLSNFPMLIPPIEEQQKIAQILSQWDEAIETTKNLITQLQLRKKGLMQELLSGKKRLAGFSEKWETIRGDKLFASISNKKHNGEFVVLSATQDKGVIPRSETGIDIKYDKKSLGNYKKLDIGDFIISLRSFQGGIEYSNYEGLVSPAYTVLREKLPIAKRFYQEYMKTENFINRLNSIIYGIRDGKQISYKEFGSLKFEYPPLEEQQAISKIIEIADEEIDEKKAYLIKLREQKKGLMQQLLTGQKRVKID